jgi:hypothetical protein
LIKEEADLQGAGLRLSPLPDLSRLVRPGGLRAECARARHSGIRLTDVGLP